MEKYNRWNVPTTLLSRYVDDCSNIQMLLRIGTVWDKVQDRLRICQEKRTADLKSGVTEEQTTASVWREVVSSLIPGIRFTTELPEDHENGMVPILDVQARMTRDKLGKDIDGEVLY